jgi:hypothetical protein
MDVEKRGRGLAYISAIKALLERIYSEDFCNDTETGVEKFAFNAGCIATENGLKKMEEELRRQQ